VAPNDQCELVENILDAHILFIVRDYVRCKIPRVRSTGVCKVLKFGAYFTQYTFSTIIIVCGNNLEKCDISFHRN
jgi:hypothetical protein